jgi:hypothetical protein
MRHNSTVGVGAGGSRRATLVAESVLALPRPFMSTELLEQQDGERCATRRRQTA